LKILSEGIMELSEKLLAEIAEIAEIFKSIED